MGEKAIDVYVRQSILLTEYEKTYLYEILLWGTRVNQSYAGVCASGMRPGVNSDMGCLSGNCDVDFFTPQKS